MRELDVKTIRDAVCKLCIDANLYLPQEIKMRIEQCEKTEGHPSAKGIFGKLLENLQIAAEQKIPICQDTGMAVIFLEVGQDLHITGGELTKAINDGVASGYCDGFLRKSVVSDPIRRINTNDNTPAIIHTKIVKGDRLSITVAPKGFGSENMSVIKMMNPSNDREDIISFVCDAVKLAGSNPCPPIIIGVGIGGNFEHCAYLSKKALLRDISTEHPDPFYACLEKDILAAVNKLGIGAQGFGGDYTALAVSIEAFATHIAGLPVAVNIGCHVTRHKKIQL